MLCAPLPVTLCRAEVSVVRGRAASQGRLVPLVRGVISCVREPVALVRELGQDRRVASLPDGLLLPPR